MTQNFWLTRMTKKPFFLSFIAITLRMSWQETYIYMHYIDICTCSFWTTVIIKILKIAILWSFWILFEVHAIILELFLHFSVCVRVFTCGVWWCVMLRSGR